MRLTQPSLYALAVAFVLLGVILATCGGAPVPVPTLMSQSFQDATKEPVLFIHGIATPGTDSFNCSDHDVWGDAKQVLEGTNRAYPVDGQTANWSYTNLITLGYYTNDKNCDVQLAPNNPNRPQAQSNNPLLDISAVLLDIERNCGVAKNTTVNKEHTSIEMLSCMVAWYIWDNFSNPNGPGKGHNVRVVAHSMGGLIIRYALYASRDACIRETLDSQNICLNFPPSLRINNVVTIDTPHGGTAADVICNGCLEGNEMVSHASGNDFMGTLYDHAQSPQGQGGTMWMLMGSACAFLGCSPTDSISAFTNSRYMKGAWLKVLYTCGHDEPIGIGTAHYPSVCYGHGSFLTDSSPYWGKNAPDWGSGALPNWGPGFVTPGNGGTYVKFCTYCTADQDGTNDTPNMPHSLYMVKYGLLGIDPRHDSYQGGASTSPIPAPSPTLMPPTQTDCPAPGTARPAVMEPFSTGSDPTIVYVENKGPSNAPTLGILQRYDVTRKSTTEIVELANTGITDAQVSTDGQWVMFVSQVSGQFKLQMVRMDGQGLQTLYCASSTQRISDTYWSPDQKSVAFETTTVDEYGLSTFTFTLYLLNISSGSLQTKQLLPVNSHIEGYFPFTWLDNARIYIIASLDTPQSLNTPTEVYILDTTNLQSNNLRLVPGVRVGLSWDFVTSADGTKLFLSQSVSVHGLQGGPSSITVQPATGGSQNTIYMNSILAVKEIQVISSTSLLLLIENQNPDGGTNTSQNGLWKMNTDGSGLTRLTSEGPTDFGTLGGVSRDGSLYALETFDDQSRTNALLIGPLSGGASTQVTSFSDGTQLQIAGWTTM